MSELSEILRLSILLASVLGGLLGLTTSLMSRRIARYRKNYFDNRAVIEALVKMADDLRKAKYGVSPPKAERVSCINCAYLTLKTHPQAIYTDEDYVWYGEMADCHHKVWERGFSEGLSEHLFDSDVAEDAYAPPHAGGEPYKKPMKPPALSSALQHDYGLSRIPTPNDNYIELAIYKCPRFYPKSELNHRTLETCWEDQQRDEQAQKEKEEIERDKIDKRWSRGLRVAGLVVAVAGLVVAVASIASSMGASK